MEQKNCKGCGELKPYSEFYPDKTMLSGCINYCKPCELKKREATTLKNRDKRLAAKRSYTKTEHAKKLKRDWYHANKHKFLVKKLIVSKRKHFPIKIKARAAVARALYSGKLKKSPCIICGSIKKIHAHHDNYLKKLDVMFLCIKHHNERHKYLKSTNHDFKGE